MLSRHRRRRRGLRDRRHAVIIRTTHKWVTKYHDAGFQQIKIYSSMKSDNVKAVCTDAHKGRGPSLGTSLSYDNLMRGSTMGVDMIDRITVYVADLCFRRTLSKLKGPERLKVMSSINVSSKQGKKAVAFSPSTTRSSTRRALAG